MGVIRTVLSTALAAALAPAQQGDAPTPTTTKEVAAFGKTLAAVIAKGDAAALGGLIDTRQLVCRAFDTRELTPGLKGFAGDLRTSSARALLARTGEADVRLLRARNRDGMPSLLFRVVPRGEIRMEYVEFLLAPGADGGLAIVDFWLSHTDALMSRTARRVWGMVMERPVLKRLFGDGTDLEQLNAFLRAGPEDMPKLFEALPKDLQKNPMILQHRIQVWRAQLEAGDGTEAAEAGFFAAVDDLVEHHPKNLGTHLLALEAYERRGDLADAAGAARRADAALGGDPFLWMREGALHWMLRDDEKAKALLRRAVAAEPDLRAAQDLLLILALRSRDHAEALRVLLHLEGKLGAPAKDLTRDPEFRDFVASPQHAELLKARAARKKQAP